MPVASMTGFARSEGIAGIGAFAWEIRSVNGKGLELRLRLAGSLDVLEPEIRRLAAQRFSRGNLQISLSVASNAERSRFTVNEAVLAEILALSDRLVAAGHAVTPTADGILSIRGVVEAQETGAAPELSAEDRAGLLAAFGAALDQLAAVREEEGRAIADVLRARLRSLDELVAAAESDPSRMPEAIRARLGEQIALLLGSTSASLDEGKFLAEAALIATRADVGEEIDRLRAHVEAAGKLLEAGGPIGRRLDFLSQEFNRESNTLCAKSNATSLTAIGLELKIVVDQFREQVQNIE
ncbi:YicC/YloC family endoribonuclease [Aureimonas psammosilenae]|uniref:YicC/YloC family endoribonuclease n=1 Tax=Aureimonas psammosilenae TaxID=2495496 RepID=UPI00126087A6|nr:YicC/YloC family endoribonuclease [Aureimonas psammosilenae]